MTKPQVIITESGEELVVLSRRDYDALRARAGDAEAEDTIEKDALTRLGEEERAKGGVSLPLELWKEMLEAPSPIGPLRRFRGLTQGALAAVAKISQAYLSEIESGKKVGDVATLRAIAVALGAGLDDITHA